MASVLDYTKLSIYQAALKKSHRRQNSDRIKERKWWSVLLKSLWNKSSLASIGMDANFWREAAGKYRNLQNYRKIQKDCQHTI